MKTKVLDAVVACMGWAVLFTVAMIPVSVHAVITGSVHDMRGTGTHTGNDQICIYCHTPHNADTTITASPLWNHEVDTSINYTLYNTLTFLGQTSSSWFLAGADQMPVQPLGVTKLCLSCHDGTVAIDSYGGMTGTVTMAGTPGTPGSRNLGTDLSDDHPVSVLWNHQTLINAGGICNGCHAGATFIAETPFFNGRVECATCHDVHNNTAYPHLLLMPVDDPDGAGPIPGSALCLRCHELSPLVPPMP